jgi:hypothetical protein
VPQRNAPAGKAKVGGVVVDRLEPDDLGQGDGHAVDDPVEVGEVERGAGPELHLSFFNGVPANSSRRL